MKKKMVYLQTCTWLEQQKREIGITEIETGQKTSRKETTNTCSLSQLPPQTSICHLRIIYEPKSHIKASLCCPFSLTPSLPKGIRRCLYQGSMAHSPPRTLCPLAATNCTVTDYTSLFCVPQLLCNLSTDFFNLHSLP